MHEYRSHFPTRSAITVSAIGLTITFLAFTSRCHGEDANSTEFFESRIRPILVQHCYECHSHAIAVPKGGLRVDSRDAIREGGESGPAVIPGDVAESLLIDAIRHESFEMPPKKKLPDTVIADFVKWIEIGAPDPRDAPPDPHAIARALWEPQFQERLNWWSLQPVVRPEVSAVKDSAWSSQPIDRFILAKLEQQGLRPAIRADKRTLIRRLSFTLTGLPPAPEQIETFLADKSSFSYEALVDRLLDSPHFGERWARHWMDVVRYTDTYGYEWDIPAKGAWRYRDYLIRAFNNDVPYDQLVREQIAGDLLESPRINESDQINESLVGPMFFQMGENRHGDSSEFNGIHQEMLDNKIDAFSKAFQAMTIACARCHDHKLDAVSQREYYALAGAFISSRWVTNTVDLPERNAELIADLKAIKSQLRPALAALWFKDTERLAGELSMVARTGGKSVSPALSVVLGVDPQGEEDSQPLPLDHPLHAWRRLVAATKENVPISQTWNELQLQYAAEQQKRSTENNTHFKIAVDFRNGIPAGWSIDGVGLENLVRCGDFNLVLDGDRAIDRLLPGGLFTNSISPRFNGAVRTPYLNTFENGHISFECCGGDFAARRTVYDNAFLTEKQVYLKHDAPRWELMSTVRPMSDRHIYIEFATKTSNPNFPPRVGLGGATTKEQEADPRSWFGITRVALHEAPFTPRDELSRFRSLFEGDAPQTIDEAARRYAAWFDDAVQAWAADQATPEHVQLLNWLLASGLLANDAADSGSRIAELVTRYRDKEQQLATPCTVNGMADIDAGYDYRLNLRGDYDQLGDAIPRGYIQALTGSPNGFTSSTSGRRELAEIVASPDNPLTARVFVNRIWQWLFGAGIVATPSDFGQLGELPSHPELLDYLAAKFMEERWSTKKLIRSIVLTQTWQQAGSPGEMATQIDPANRLLHHYPLRRLEAEAIRDAMLSVSRQRDPQLFGPPIDPARANEDPQKRLFSGPLDGNGRRSIYTKITIMEPPRLLALFNQPEPKISIGRRDVANTPAQSLALLNDLFVQGQAEHWAERLVATQHESVAARLNSMFQAAFGREPGANESKRWEDAVSDFASLHQVSDPDVLAHVALWKNVAHAIFNTKEFIYVR